MITRAELTALEHSEHVSEWIRLEGEKSKLKAQIAPSGHTGGRPDKGINAAVKSLGIDRSGAQRAVKIDSITPDAKFTQMRKIAYIAKHPETAHGAAKKKDPNFGSLPAFIDATANATGKSRTDVARDAWRGAAIIPAALDAIKAGGRAIDKGVNRRRHTPGAFGTARTSRSSDGIGAYIGT